MGERDGRLPTRTVSDAMGIRRIERGEKGMPRKNVIAGIGHPPGTSVN
jgi:hypothetical protein